MHSTGLHWESHPRTRSTAQRLIILGRVLDVLAWAGFAASLIACFRATARVVTVITRKVLNHESPRH